MKKLLICMFALATFAMVACGDQEDETPDYAAKFVGTYDVTVNAVLNIPMYGEVEIPMNDMEAVVARKATANEVTMTAMNQTLNGYCNESGLHLDPFAVNSDIMGISMSITVTIPTVAAPTSSTITGTAALAATVMGASVTGNANYTAVKR